MKMDITDEDITDLLIFLEMAKNRVIEMKLHEEDEYLRKPMLKRVNELLDKFTIE